MLPQTGRYYNTVSCAVDLVDGFRSWRRDGSGSGSSCGGGLVIISRAVRVSSIDRRTRSSVLKTVSPQNGRGKYRSAIRFSGSRKFAAGKRWSHGYVVNLYLTDDRGYIVISVAVAVGSCYTAACKRRTIPFDAVAHMLIDFSRPYDRHRSRAARARHTRINLRRVQGDYNSNKYMRINCCIRFVHIVPIVIEWFLFLRTSARATVSIFHERVFRRSSVLCSAAGVGNLFIPTRATVFH